MNENNEHKQTSQQQTSPQSSLSETSDTRKPYQKPSLEIHSDSNLWAFGTLGG